MTQLKSNFSIEANDDNAAVILLALKGLGYAMTNSELEDVLFGGMEGYNRFYTGSENRIFRMVRTKSSGYDLRYNFTNFNDFLKWHNAPEKSEAEIELDKLNEKMQELQAQINRVTETVKKEKS